MSVSNDLNMIDKMVNLVTLFKSKNWELKESKENNLYKAVCPFCEKEGFVINNDKNLFYCFSCHCGGDAVTFLCKKYNVSPLELAEKIKGPVFNAFADMWKVE